MSLKDDKSLAEELAKGNEKAFETIFNKYYQSLCLFSHHYLNDDELAEETVQDLFVKIWEKRFTLTIETSLEHYLFRAARNLCYNQIQHKKIKNQYAERVLKETETEIRTENYFLEPDLKNKIATAIDALPEKRKEIFRLSRENGLKYKEIAEELNISIKTVETQMGLALKFLREKLRDYEDLLTLLLIVQHKKK